MPLTGEQYEKLIEALISAFPSKSKLTRLLKLKLDKSLNKIVSDGSLEKIVFDLIDVTEAEGWTEDLILAAREENPGNSKLLLVIQELDLGAKSLEEDIEKPLETLKTTKQNDRSLQVFLCHASADKGKVRLLYKKLSEVDCTPWLDEENIVAGQIWQEEIREAVQSADVVLVCLSRRSFNHGGYRSGFMREEIRFALNEASNKKGDIYIIPVRLTNCQVPKELISLQRVDFFRKNGFKQLIEALKIKSSNLDNVRLPKLVDGKANGNKPLFQLSQNPTLIYLSLFLVLTMILSTDIQKELITLKNSSINCPKDKSPFKVISIGDGDFLTKKRKQSDSVFIIKQEELEHINKMMSERIIVEYTGPQETDDSIKFFIEHLSHSSLHLLIDRNGNVAQSLPFNKQTLNEPRWNNLVASKDFSIVISLVNSGFLEKSESGEWLTYFGDTIPENEVTAKYKNKSQELGWHEFPPEQIETFRHISCTLAHYYDLKNILGRNDIDTREDSPGPAFPMDSVRNYVYGEK